MAVQDAEFTLRVLVAALCRRLNFLKRFGFVLGNSHSTQQKHSHGVILDSQIQDAHQSISAENDSLLD